MEKKLELKHLAPYLPYGVQLIDVDGHAFYKGFKTSLVVRNYSDSFADGLDLNQAIEQFKLLPILRPLSDYKEINSPAMKDLNCDLSDQIRILELANKEVSFYYLPYGIAQLLFEAHIDSFNLIPDGLAIDINSLTPKP